MAQPEAWGMELNISRPPLTLAGRALSEIPVQHILVRAPASAVIPPPKKNLVFFNRTGYMLN